ncbi:hypothetical protein BFL36_10130 [Clavibacter michiganensis]|uniref:Uncharacterized protein n=1 Tax=Clavibacter michiganensis TaxID=28447 RepID=A0A251YDX6_9MICO|nr:hypothetical protein [Clavibacter michiganensis]OUE22442.1 hypothetical protein BFL36_10130 [Clavibacter michiganensis]
MSDEAGIRGSDDAVAAAADAVGTADDPSAVSEVEAGGAGDAGDADVEDVAEELVSRLELIEGQPLGERAASFALLHDELRTRLEGGDGVSSRV